MNPLDRNNLPRHYICISNSYQSRTSACELCMTPIQARVAKPPPRHPINTSPQSLSNLARTTSPPSVACYLLPPSLNRDSPRPGPGCLFPCRGNFSVFSSAATNPPPILRALLIKTQRASCHAARNSADGLCGNLNWDQICRLG